MKNLIKYLKLYFRGPKYYEGTEIHIKEDDHLLAIISGAELRNLSTGPEWCYRVSGIKAEPSILFKESALPGVVKVKLNQLRRSA